MSQATDGSFFTPDQLEKLRAYLDHEKVKSRSQAGQELSYIEGYVAVQACNDIFGFGNWEANIVNMVTTEQVTPLDELCPTNRSQKKGYRVSKECILEVTVHNLNRTDTVTHTDIGHGHGTTYDALGTAHESAAKEASTDALKRTLRYFGNQFGLALYDKEQREVTKPVDLDQVMASFKDLPPALKDSAKEGMTDILRKHSMAKPSDAVNNQVVLRELLDYLAQVGTALKAAA